MSLKPTRGTISVFNQDLASVSWKELPVMRRRMGLVFQDFRLLDHLTTYENVSLSLRVLGRSEPEYRKDVLDFPDWV